MSATDTAAARTNSSPLRIALGGLGLAGLGALGALVALEDIAAPYEAGMMRTGEALAPPLAPHAFGTDLLGRDIWSETVHGLAVTMADAVGALPIALAAGTFAGFLAAHMLRYSGPLLRAAANALIAVPALFLAVLFAALLGHQNAVVAAGLAVAPAAFARSYDRAHSLLASPHADFARATGLDRWSLFRRDLIFELRESIVAVAARALAAVVILLSTLSFFGFGAAPPARDLGLMIAAARGALPEAWWTAGFPLLALALFILAARLAAGLSEGERA